MGSPTNTIRQGSILGLKYEGVATDELTGFRSFSFTGTWDDKAISVELLVPGKILIDDDSGTRFSSASELEYRLEKGRSYVVDALYLPPDSTIGSGGEEVAEWCGRKKFETLLQELVCEWFLRFGLVRQKIEWKDYAAEMFGSSSKMVIGHPGSVTIPLGVQ